MALDYWTPYAVVAGGVTVGTGLAYALAQVVNPYFVWGGMDCGIYHGIEACASYAPAGFMLSVVAGTVGVGFVLSSLTTGGGD